MFLVYMGAQPIGLYYQRFVYGFMDLLSKAGGLLNGLHKGLLILSIVLCKITADTKLVSMILKPYMEKDNNEYVLKNIKYI